MIRILAAAWLVLTLSGLAEAATYTSASTTYYLIDSSSHSKVGYNTAPYKFNAAAGCGTAPPALDDTLSDAIPLGFTFVFGGTGHTSARIMSNGRLQFGNTTCGSGTNAIGPPQTYPYGFPVASMNGVMKIFGVDLDHTNLVDVPNYPASSRKTPCASTTSCYVSVATLGTAPSRQFVVTWKNVPEWVAANNTSGSFDLQIVLNEDGSFVFQYGSIVHGGTGTAQIGWQLSTTDFQVLAFGASAEPPPNSAIIFYIPSPISAYRFEEGAWAPGVAGQVTDASGKGRPGKSLGNAQPLAGGKVCRAVDIPPNTSAATVDAVMTGVDLSSSALAMLGTGTVAFWFKSNAAWNNGVAAQLLDASATSGQWFYLAKTASGTLYFEVTDSTGVNRSVETPAQAFAADTWVHVALAWNFNGAAAANSDSLSLWINGGTPTTASFTSNGTITTAVSVVHLGDNPSGFVGSKGAVNSANGQLDEAQFYNYVLTTAQLATLVSASRTCTTLAFDHLELQHASGAGITCTPTVLTVRACLNASCSSLYTSGLAGTLKTTGAASSAFDGNSGNGAGAAFVIPAGSSSVSKGVQVTTVGNTVVGVNSLSITANGAYSCNFGAPSCTLSAVDAGFIVSAPHHVSEAASTLTLSAVRKSDNGLACVPAFASTSKNVTLSCSYANPASGTLPLRVAGSALNATASAAAACDAGGRALSLSFDASGVATPALQYADVGQLSLAARYNGSAATNDTGLVLSGSSASFTVAPASFGFSAVTAAPIRAGIAFAATVSARNSAGATTPNFGRESVPEGATLSFAKRSPAGSGASNGVFTGSLGAFANGSVTAANLVWSEVGSADLSATLTSASYLGSGMGAAGSTGNGGAVGPFIPHHFDVAATPACSAVFSYGGQPFASTVTARNGLSPAGTTVNYDGSSATTPNQAGAVSLSEASAPGLGSLAGNSIAAGAFTAGVATGNPSYSFTSKTTAPQTLTLRAGNGLGGTAGISSAGYVEASMPLRSGRLRLSNAYGSASAALQLPVVAEYWSASSWVLNSADNCTVLPGSSVVLSNPRNAAGSSSSTASSAAAGVVVLANGSGLITLAAPTPAGSSLSLDLAINLGSSSTDQSCQTNHPASVGAAKPWLRAQNGSCAATADRDPSARASFGIYSPETRKTVHVRELF